MAAPKKAPRKPPEAKKKEADEEETLPATVANELQSFQGGVPAGLDDMEEDAGGGLEEVGIRDQEIPFIKIAASLSPQVQKVEPNYIEGLEVGMIFNQSTEQFWDGDEGIFVVPVGYQKQWIEWPLERKKGGFPVHIYDADEGERLEKQCTRNDKNKLVMPDGETILEETAVHFVFFRPVSGDGAWNHAVIPMASTQLKKSRKWITKLMNVRLERKDGAGTYNPASYATAWKLTTQPEQNEKGNWFGWVIEGVGMVSDPDLYSTVREFAHRVRRGEVEVKYRDDAVGDGDEIEEADFEEATS